jgi:trehalose 6-phosphate synthase/phosphatase
MGIPGSGGRLVLVANRLPVSVSFQRSGLEVRPSSGGLATGLRRLTAERGMLWVGWAGAAAPSPELRAGLDEKLRELSAVAVHLSASESQRFYEGTANGVLWPLFHYLLDRVPRVVRHWDAYVQANQRFCDVVSEHATEDDLIWIHDYHLFLLPAMLRARMPRARIGFFLHIPFPSWEVFRTLPHREEVLRGLLGADVIGFHSYDYLRHFGDSLLGNLGLEIMELDRVEVDDHTVRLGVFPMGIDAERFSRMGSDVEVLAESERLRTAQAVEKILLGVDRLDYTKGLPRKILALERLLERSPKFRGKVRLIQIAVPSREHVDAYRTLRRDVEELIGHTNGNHSTLHGAPIHYLYRSVSEAQLVASYRAADVMLVTPLRDGMNLVAKEFVASRVDGDGVLVLSELAGAASELGEAVIVNPYDVEALADSFDRALSMGERERRDRMSALRQKVLSRTVQLWADTFTNALGETRRDSARADGTTTAEELSTIAERLARSPHVTFALDYDGTLVPLRERPELARPDPELIALLSSLARLPGVAVHIVSGRTRNSLSEWLGELPIGLAAEHGFWLRRADAREWQPAFDPTSCTWKPLVRAVLEEYLVRTPGAMIEEKAAGLAWHYRNATPHLGTLRARELRLHLVQSLAQTPVTILTGRKVVEVRPQGVDKGQAVRAMLADAEHDTVIAAFGDDRTDEELFAALPETAYTFRAGPGPTRARYRVNGPETVRIFLSRFLELRSTGV